MLTCSCIESIINKTSKLKYEIILVDNHSSETNPDEFLKYFPGLILIKNQINVGFAKGCNLGIDSAQGKYILLLNSDTVLKNNAVAIGKNFLCKNPLVAVVSSLLVYPDNSIQNNCQRFPSIKYGVFELLRLQKFLPRRIAGKILFGPFFNYNTVVFPDWVWGTFFMFEKTKLNNLPNKKLADDFFLYVEDMQWCKDFRLAGFKIAFEPAAKVIHLMEKSGGFKNDHIQQNTNLFMTKYYSQLQVKIIKWINQKLLIKRSFNR